MKRLATLVGVLVLAFPTGAEAARRGDDSRDHDGRCEGGYCAGEDNRGDCRGSDGPCEDNDFSPSFQDSPVRDAFNFAPVVCLPMSTCNFDGRGGEQQPR